MGKKCSDSSNQKFVLGATDSEDPQTLKLKYLESGQLLGLEKDGFKGEDFELRSGLEESEATLFAQQDARRLEGPAHRLGAAEKLQESRHF